MNKAKLIGIEPRHLSAMAWNRDSRRNVLGVIKRENLEAFVEEFTKACEAAGLSCSPFIKDIGYVRANRLEIFNDRLQKDIDSLSKKTVGVLGLFFNEATTYQPDGTKLPDLGYLELHIYYTIKRKSLTRFRKFLLDHIVEVEEPLNQGTKS
ncbi:hypothetical protein EHV15_34480 [Paenibacillus oralis]|uniref:Uncharacterized protein n=1 Tax=Paenibacillus oralis TaxID=2490856 RepID=A0A3P3T9K2_9BACL|nr:hypothetical protein [Paenibacillus oralis]RRJ54706.1 hypothetical protein EHV15_34480 [Paenibacillus oralis]